MMPSVKKYFLKSVLNLFLHNFLECPHIVSYSKSCRSSFQNYCSPSCKPQSSQHEPFFLPTTINVTLRQILQSGNHTCKPVLNPFQRNNETHLFLTNKPTKRSRRCHTCERIASWTVTGYQPVLGLTDFPTSSVFGLDVRFSTCSDWNYISNPRREDTIYSILLPSFISQLMKY